MTKKVDFYFDFASPNAYLSHKVMQSIKERTGAEINYIPVLLGGIFKLTNNKPPMEQFFGVKNKNEYQNIELMNQMQDPEVKAKLISNTEAAAERGVFGIPTFFVEDEMYFGKDNLWQVEEKLGE